VIVCGIDPGAQGAIAFLSTGASGIVVIDMPYANGEVEAGELASLLRAGDPDIVWLESVHSMTGQGVATMWKMGENVGVVKGVCGALKLPRRMVTPQTWKRTLGVRGKGLEGKRAAVALARQLWPAERWLSSKHGRADAALIADYGRRQLSTGHLDRARADVEADDAVVGDAEVVPG